MHELEQGKGGGGKTRGLSRDQTIAKASFAWRIVKTGDAGGPRQARLQEVHHTKYA